MCMIHLSNSGERDSQAEGKARTKSSRQTRMCLAHLSNNKDPQRDESVGNASGVGVVKAVEVRKVGGGQTLWTPPTHFPSEASICAL